MQTELVNQIEVKLRKIYQAAYQPAYLEKMLACAENYSNNTRGSIDTISEKTSILLLMVTAFSKKTSIRYKH